MTEQSTLKKELGLAAALSTVMGTVIGAGVFFKASSVYATTGNEGLGLLAWLLGGVITLCAGLTGAELAAAIPATGGMLTYIEHTYGKVASHLLGWAQTIIYYPANVAALAIIFGTQCCNLFGLSERWVVAIGAVAALTVTFLNCLGSKVGGTVQTVSTICKLIPLALIVVFGLFQSHPNTISLFPMTPHSEHGNVFQALGSGLLAAMFAYDGWISVGNIAGEMKNPEKDLPKAISLGLIGIMIVYILINIAFLMTLSMGQIAGNENAASDVAMRLFGPLGGKIVTIGILISVYGAINGYTITGMRIPYIMAVENRLPFSNVWKKLSKKSRVPVNAGILILVIAIIYMMSGKFDMLTDMLIFVIWIFYTMTFMAVIILRKREPELKRPYKVPGYPIVPIIAVLGGLFIIINTAITQFKLAALGVVITLLGLIFYKRDHGPDLEEIETEEKIESKE